MSTRFVFVPAVAMLAVLSACTGPRTPAPSTTQPSSAPAKTAGSGVPDIGEWQDGVFDVLLTRDASSTGDRGEKNSTRALTATSGFVNWYRHYGDGHGISRGARYSVDIIFESSSTRGDEPSQLSIVSAAPEQEPIGPRFFPWTTAGHARMPFGRDNFEPVAQDGPDVSAACTLTVTSITQATTAGDVSCPITTWTTHATEGNPARTHTFGLRATYRATTGK